MECPNSDCLQDVPAHLRYCVVCGADAKVPNLRAANIKDEVEALRQRVRNAEREAALQGCEKVFNDFRKAVASSSAVVCRSLGQVSDVVSSDNQLFATFYQNVNGDARLPEDNEWDRIRQSVDSLLFPYYYQELRFAALSIDGSGVSGYGDYCVVLKDMAIKDRATVFEENTILFVRHQGIVPGNQLPLGYRATWSNRDMLAVAKLSTKLNPSTTPTEFQSILVSSPATDADFIEVHIYGPIHRRAISRLSGPEPRKKADKVILRSVLGKLKEIGAAWEVRP